MNTPSILILIILVIALSGCGDQSPSKSPEQEVKPKAQVGQINKDEVALGPQERVAKLIKDAEAGDADAQHKLAIAYRFGKGVPKDAAKAVEWYQKAAAQGDADAQFNLGWMYDNGEGVPKDAGKAFEWFQKAAEQGHAQAQFNLGWMYYLGEGVPKDAAKAVEWYQKAANQGHANAQLNLGLIYEHGQGVPKDNAKAVEWFEKGAGQGHAQAQFNLGLAYMRGVGTARDGVLAYAWLNLAAAGGDNESQQQRDFVEKDLSGAERAEGQRLATNWKRGMLLARETASAADSSAKAGKVKQDAPTKRMTGTGFVISNSGHILTNNHLVEGYTEVRISGRDGAVKLLAADVVNDLALLQGAGETKDCATLAPESFKLRQGEDIVVYGYPLNSVLSTGGNFTPGLVSALSGLGNNTNQIQITAPIQPGSSGSPVINKKGHVVGVVSMKLSDEKIAKATGSVPQNVNFAVNAQTVRSFLDTNKAPYSTGSGFFARERSSADIAEEARKWTVIVECWK